MSNFVRNLIGVLTIALYGFVTQTTSAAYGFLVMGSVVAVVLIIPLVQLFRYQKR